MFELMLKCLKLLFCLCRNKQVKFSKAESETLSI